MGHEIHTCLAVELNRRFDWLTFWAKSKFGEQSPYIVPPTIQPVIDVSQNWPPAIAFSSVTDAMAAGTATYRIIPDRSGGFKVGAEDALPIYSQFDRYSMLVVGLYISMNVSLNVEVNVVDTLTDDEYNQVFNATGTELYVLGVDGNRRPLFIEYPFCLQIRVLGISSGNITIRTSAYSRPAAEPIIQGYPY